MGFEAKRQQIIEDLQVLPDRFEQFSYIVDRGKAHPPLESALRTDTFRVEGCQSQLWLVPAQREDGSCHFRTDSDSAIVKGIGSIICDYFSGEQPADILGANVDFLQEVGIDQHLSSNRRNGLGKVEERIKRFAQSCLDAQ